MSTKDLYDPKQVSTMLNLPSSTLRRYCQLYGEFLSETAQIASKKRRYSNQDVLRLKEIKELSRSKHTPEQIKTALQLVTEEPTAPGPPGNNALALLPQIAAEFEQLRISQAETNQTVEQLRQELDQLRQELEYQRIPWYKRFSKKKPN